MSSTRRRPDIETRFENAFDFDSLFDHISFHQSIVIIGVNTVVKSLTSQPKVIFFVLHAHGGGWMDQK